jgi:putative NADH-flavin reductase
VKLAVAGAAGRTGREVVTQALARGHQVQALVRNPHAFQLHHPRLTAITGDVLQPGTLDPLVDGVDAVISTIGIGAQRTPTQVYSAGTQNLLETMAGIAAQRIITISSGTLADGPTASLGQRMLLYPLLHRLYGASYTDMRRMEQLLEKSAVEWTVMRPPYLADKPASGNYRFNTAGITRGIRTLAYPDLAAALLDALQQPDWFRKTVTISGC